MAAARSLLQRRRAEGDSAEASGLRRVDSRDTMRKSTAAAAVVAERRRILADEATEVEARKARLHNAAAAADVELRNALSGLDSQVRTSRARRQKPTRMRRLAFTHSFPI